MAGLNNTISDTQETSTTMPAWYDAAQQNIVNQGAEAMANAPTLNNTVAQGAIDQLSGSNNPFTQAQNSLNTIAAGAANPWIVDQSTGAVTPNTNTAMGGLFAAQQNELNQLMPNYSAPAQAGGISSGNFGSLRGQTAVQKGRGDAFAKLNAAQMQAALSNQSTGAAAAANLGTVGKQGIDTTMNVGQTQMNAPFNNVANYANLISSMPVATTTKSQIQFSPLSQIQTFGNLGKGGLDSLRSLYATPGGKSLLDSIGIGRFLSDSLKNTVSEYLPNGAPNPDFIGPIDNGGGSSGGGGTVVDPGIDYGIDDDNYTGNDDDVNYGIDDSVEP
jgi:hypothetical protein